MCSAFCGRPEAYVSLPSGAAIAFILNVPMRFIEKNILGGLLRMKETSRAKRPLSLLLAILFVLVIVAVVSLVVIPELTGTLLGLKRLVPAFFENMQIQRRPCLPDIRRS